MSNFELTKADMMFVVQRLPKSVRELLMKENTLVVAGGFIRSVIAGEPVQDIDILGPDAEKLAKIAESFKDTTDGRTHKTKNAVTVLPRRGVPVQFITRWTFKSAADVIKSFDFTVCQAAVWFENKRWWSCIEGAFYPDLAARRLVYTQPVRVEELGGSLLRAIKFIKRGYNIQAPSLAKLIARIASGVRTRKLDIADESATWPVFCGLLREVDPLHTIEGIEIDEPKPGEESPDA